MQGSPERQHLDEALKDERIGSPKIQALAHYAMLKDVEWQTENRPAVIDELDGLQLIAQKAVAEHHIDMWKLRAEVDAFFEAFDNAAAIIAPYLASDDPQRSPYQLFLEDLKEINWEKGRK